MTEYIVTITATIKSPLDEGQLRDELVLALYSEDKGIVIDTSGDPDIIDGDLEVIDYEYITVEETS